MPLASDRDLSQVAAYRDNALSGLANPAICGETRVIPTRSGVGQSAFPLHVFASLLFTPLRLSATPQIAKRTQFHSKHIVLQILTTKIFLFCPKANLMNPTGTPQLSDCSSERELAQTDVLISDLWIQNAGFGRLRKVTESSRRGACRPPRQRFNISSFLPRRSLAGKLTLTTKLTQKSNHSKTRSDHFFHRPHLKLIHWIAKMLPAVADPLPQMLPFKLLPFNDVTDVTAFPTSYINYACLYQPMPATRVASVSTFQQFNDPASSEGRLR